jgi:pSer/pThr/pTyr-binding forkhead associated (FHA) protein
MVLSVQTIKITIGETPVPKARRDSINLGSLVFLHVEGSPIPIEVRLTDGIEVVMGRHDPENTSKMFVDLGNFHAQEKGVSRKHAALLYNGGSLRVADLGSLNSTFVNGDPIAPNLPRSLRDGDVITMGTLSMTVRFA